MFLKINKKLLLTIAVLIGLGFRIIAIDSNPLGVHADEADSGYNAYSILKTGKDIYGNFLPLQITGFAQNYRTPISTYLTVPFVAILDLNTFSIRLPAVLIGAAVIFLVYLLGKKLFDSEKIGIISAFIIAFNPWAIHISRPYADHILAIFFVLLGLIFIFKKKGEKTSFFLGGVFLGLSLFSYHAPKIFLPLFLPFVIWYLFPKPFKNKTNILFLIVGFGIFFIFSIYLSLFRMGAQELNTVSILNDTNAAKLVNKERTVTTAPLSVSSLFHNKPLYFAKRIGRNYFQSLSINHLFLDGDGNLTAWIQDKGLFYLVELPFLFIGFYFIFRKNRRLGVLLLAWTLISSVPGAITNNFMYTYRNIYLLPVLVFIISYGLYYSYASLKRKSVKMLLVFLIFLFYLYGISSFIVRYYFDYPQYSYTWWAGGQKDALLYAKERENEAERVFVNGGLDWPLLYAFYNKVDPGILQKELVKIKQDSSKNIMFNKYEFGNIKIDKDDNPKDFFEKGTMFIGSHSDFEYTEADYRILSKDDWGTLYRIYIIK